MQTLEYGKTPKPNLQRIARRGLAISAVLGFVLLVAYQFNDPVTEWWRVYRYQHSLLNYFDQPGMVIYEEEADAASKLLDCGGYQRVPYEGTLAGVDWNPVSRTPPTGIRLGTRDCVGLFAHERTPVRGRNCLVTVELRSMNREAAGDGRVLEFVGYAVQVISLRHPTIAGPEGYTFFHIPNLAPGDHVRIFAGEPDRGDSSKFVIPLQVNDKAYVLHGSLKDDKGSVDLSLEEAGSAKSP